MSYAAAVTPSEKQAVNEMLDAFRGWSLVSRWAAQQATAADGVSPGASTYVFVAKGLHGSTWYPWATLKLYIVEMSG
jgi:hypothetical protein